jgi:hypothetical protein
MHADTLQVVGKKYNLTRHKYTSDDGTIEREYLLDVNPWIWQRVRGDGQNIIDARWIDVRNGLFIDITGIAETDPKNPGVHNCKNYHRYRPEDIWPLRDTTFEGVPAKIPYNFDPILVKEYGYKALVVTEYEGSVSNAMNHFHSLTVHCSHRWNVQKKAWESAPDVPTGRQGALKNPRIPDKYSTVETGGFFYNVYRLIHWWE